MTQDVNHLAEESPVAVRPPVPDLPAPDGPPPGPDVPQECIAPAVAPAPATLYPRRGARPGRPEPVLAALTPDALWIQSTWQLRHVPLRTLGKIEPRRRGRELVLSFLPDHAADGLTLRFARAAEGQRWLRELQARQQPLPPDGPGDDRPAPEGVTLLTRAADESQVELGRVEFTGRDARTADRGLQLRAGMRGADAVVRVERRRGPGLGWGARRASGLAVRVRRATDRARLRQLWYADEVGALVRRMLLLLVVQAALLLLIPMFAGIAPGITGPTGDTPPQALAAAAPQVGLLLAWPLLLVALLGAVRWPPLLRLAALAVLAATAGRTLAVFLAHLIAVGTAGVAPANGQLWFLASPVDWAVLLAGVVLWRRARRLAGDAPRMLPPGPPAVGWGRRALAWGRRALARGLLALTAVYALVLGGFTVAARYATSAHLLQPGVDARREHQALRALKEGAALEDTDLAAAERAWRRALPLWEELAALRPAPPVYRANLSRTLNNLGRLSRTQGRMEEAEKYYARASALAVGLAGDPGLDDECERALRETGRALADLRDSKQEEAAREKDERGVRKCEEAEVKAMQGAPEADGLFREAIALWEEILPQATGPEYRRFSVARLASAYLELGEVRLQQGKFAEAEAALRRSIDYGEQAVALAPDRPRAKHNLEVARRMLERRREHALEEEVTRLCAAERFADAGEAWARGIAEQEEQVRSGKDREAAVRSLAYRLHRFAWFLAHCPDGRVRDPREAVRRARRATELRPDVGEYWYTLATAQYRNGDWRDSLASLERVKAVDGSFDATGWLLVALNRHRLKQRAEAREALRKAAEWSDERRRQAEDNPALRFGYETLRPTIERLRREAEKLIEENDPANRVVG